MKKYTKTKLIYGLAINDADYPVRPIINGKPVLCPFYSVWVSMLNRSYCKKSHQKKLTYIGCSVVDEWLTFSKFKSWMIKQDWKGKALDKDVLVQGNKVYSPLTCIFVTQSINSLLNKNAALRGKYALGVCFNKCMGKYSSTCRVDGKNKHLGFFYSPEEAHEVYK